MSLAPVRLPWLPAIEHIEGLLLRARAANAFAPAVLAITGPVGAGKSTLAQHLRDSACNQTGNKANIPNSGNDASSLKRASILRTDDYLPDYDMVPEEERDLPHHADFARLARDLASLRAGTPTLTPRWSFQTHRREGEQLTQPAGLIILEGIHALHDPTDHPIQHLIDARAFVEAPAGVRWQRWEHLEFTGQRGWGVAIAREFFHAVAEPTFARYESLYRARADVIVINDATTQQSV